MSITTHRTHSPKTLVISASLISFILFSALFIAGCSQKASSRNHSAQPLAAYLIDYSALNHTLHMQSIDVTPPSAGQSITGKAGLYQAGHAVFDGLAITAPVYITNNGTDDWTGVVMQAYGLDSGDATVCDADQGTDWYVNNPDNGAWGWVFTSGTAGSEFTIPQGGRSAVTPMGFNANSNFVSVVYIYDGAPIIQDVEPPDAITGETVTITGYNFSSTQGVVTFNGITATVQKWEDKDIVVTVPDQGTDGDIIVHTVDPKMPYSNPYKCKKDKVSIDCSTPGPNPVNAGWSMSCTVYAQGGKPEINSSADTCGGSLSEGGYCGENWTYTFRPSAGQSGTCTAAVVNGTAAAQAVVTINGVSPWPKFRGNIRNTGLSPIDTSSVTGQLKWRYPINISGGSCGVYASPAIGADGTIYVSSGDDFYAINPDGTLKWRYQSGNNAFYSSVPALGADGTIYVGTFDVVSGAPGGNLFAFNPDGTIKWTYHTEDLINASPTIGADGTIYVAATAIMNGNYTGNFYAFNPDGTLKWVYSTSNLMFNATSPAIGADGTVYITTDGYNLNTNLYAFDPNGTLKWSYTVGSICSSPALGADGTIYVLPNGTWMFAINPDGTLKGFNLSSLLVTMDPGACSSPAIGADGTIYVGAQSSPYGGFYALSPDGSTVKWVSPVPVSDSSPAIGADGTIYVGSDDGNIYAFNPDGTIKWSYKTEGYIDDSPAIGPDGTIYIGSADGYLYAFH